MSNTTSNPSIAKVALHTVLTVITGGFWLIVLFIYAILKYMKNN